MTEDERRIRDGGDEAPLSLFDTQHAPPRAMGVADGLGRLRCSGASTKQAAKGFEPLTNGFAIRPLSPLGYAAELPKYRK